MAIRNIMNPKFNYSFFCFFRNFIKNLRMAQQTAMKKKKSVEVIWRGYKDVVEPAEPLLSTPVLRGRLFHALESISKSKKQKKFVEKEQYVSVYFFKINYTYSIMYFNKQIFETLSRTYAANSCDTSGTSSTVEPPPIVIRKSRKDSSLTDIEVMFIFSYIYNILYISLFH